MKYRTMGRTDVKVSEICLGTMTWGSSQNTEQDAHQQISMALDNGVTFWDTAELYPVNPMSAETQGDTERFIGSWLKQHKNTREKLVLASKVSGPGRHLRNGEGFNRKSIKDAIDGTLERLGTDYVDLYYLHFPNRRYYHHGNHWAYMPENPEADAAIEANMLETLETIGELVKAGKIKHFGLSNETAWGVMAFLRLAEQHGLPRVAALQNEYNLMYRLFDTDLLEVCMREGVSLMPYSPLAAGWLTGKYYHEARPEGSRFTLPSYRDNQRLVYHAQKAADAYVDVARKHELDPAQMAIAFTLLNPCVASSIIGATTLEQMEADIGAAKVVLDDAVLKDIDAVRRMFPMPY